MTDLVGEWELGDLPEIRWVIDGILPAESLGVLYAPAGAGKSFLALSMVLSVASGRPWFGAPIADPRPTIYVAGEGWAGMGLRVASWKAHHGISERLSCYFRPGPVNLLNPVDVMEFTQSIAAALGGEEPGLVVLDTLRTCLGSESEDSADSVGAACGNALEIVRSTGATVLLVHHTGWNKTRERGSTALRASADVMLRLEAEERDLTLKCDKARDFTPFEALALRVQPDNLGSAVIVERDPAPSEDVFGPKHRELLAVLRDLGDAGTATMWQLASQESVANMARRTFYRHLGLLLDHGFVSLFQKRYVVNEKGLAKLVPSAKQVPLSADGTGQLVPPVPPPYKGVAGTDRDTTSSGFEMGDAYEPEEAEA